jgi:hypothetical protein
MRPTSESSIGPGSRRSGVTLDRPLQVFAGGSVRRALLGAVAACVSLGGVSMLIFQTSRLYYWLPNGVQSLLAQPYLWLASYGVTGPEPELILQVVAFTSGGAVWGVALARISGYRPAALFAAAGGLSFGPLVAIEVWATPGVFVPLPDIPGGEHLSFALILAAALTRVTFANGVAFGLAIRSVRAAVALGAGAALAAVVASLAAQLALAQVGILVGSGDGDMPKVTIVANFAAAAAAGAALAVLCQRYVGAGRRAS